MVLRSTGSAAERLGFVLVFTLTGIPFANSILRASTLSGACNNTNNRNNVNNNTNDTNNNNNDYERDNPYVQKRASVPAHRRH